MSRRESGAARIACPGMSADRRMTRFVNETANILKLVQDVLRPRTFEAFLKHGLDDPPA